MSRGASRAPDDSRVWSLLYVSAIGGLSELARSLERRFTVEPCAIDELPARSAIEWWDVIAFDLDFPTAADLRQVIEAKRRWPAAPVLMFVSGGSFELALWALHSRAVFDIIVKPADAGEVNTLQERLVQVLRARRAQLDRQPQLLGAPAPAATRFRPRLPVNARLAAVAGYVAKHHARAIAQPKVAALCGLSPARFSRQFRASYGMTFTEFLARYRIERAQLLLSNPHVTISDVAAAVGIDAEYFSRLFRRYTGTTPTEFRAGAAPREREQFGHIGTTYQATAYAPRPLSETRITAMPTRKTRAAPARCSDATADRLRAYIASMRPLRGVDLDDDDRYQRGRALIERLAIAAGDTNTDPALRLTARDCADVLAFIAASEPLEPATWWDDPPEGPSQVAGFYLLVRGLEPSLRAIRQR